MGNCCASGEDKGDLHLQSSIKRGSPNKTGKAPLSIIEFANEKVKEVYEKLGDFKEGTWTDDGVVIVNLPEI